MKIIIRQENDHDKQKIFEVNKEAFDRDNESRLVDLLRTSEAYIPELSLVAIVDNEIVGHILFTKIRIYSDKGNESVSLALAPMAIKKEYQRKGIGGELIKKGLSTAKTVGYESVIVLGHPEYYPKFGFAPAIQWDIKAPFEVPSEAFMAMELIKNGLKNISGTVQYPKEFEMV